MKHRAKVTSKGQVTIPRDVRERLRLHAGDFLIFETDADGEIRVRASSNRPETIFAQYEGSWREGEGMTVDEVNDFVRELRGRNS